MRRNYGIVVIGYNNVSGIKRLCESLVKADYYNETVDLIISLDFCDNMLVKKFADGFQWEYGKKRVIFHETRMGLRNHILSCGEFLKEYSALAVFEDDIYVSPAFYSYMKQTVEFYEDNPKIAGIALYSFERNWYTGLGFKPAQSEYDIFFMQMAQSWGQIWLKKQWNDFYEWYLQNQDAEVIEKLHVPLAIKKWRNDSWLKYHTAYCVIKNKYFVYPYKSLTTCFADAGVHTRYSNLDGQVSLYNGKSIQYNLAELSTDAIKYDVFYERTDIEKYMPYLNDNVHVCVDLYGSKYSFQSYTHILTTNKYVGITPIHSWGMWLKPQELNVLCNLVGEDIFLYDIRNINIDEIKVKSMKWKRMMYFSSPKFSTDFNMMLMYLKKIVKKYVYIP